MWIYESNEDRARMLDRYDFDVRYDDVKNYSYI